MSLVHLHLVLNHIPVVGLLGVVLLLCIAVARQSDELTRVSLAFLAVLGLITVVVVLTGEPAEALVENLAGVSHDAVERHEDVARLAAISMYAVGAAALGALVFLRHRRVPRVVAPTTLVLSLLVAALMGVTANTGGQIRHSEISAATASDLEEMQER